MGELRWNAALLKAGLYTGYARERLGVSDRDNRRRDESAWRAANQADTVRAYRDYLERYPEGRYSAEARTRIKQLRTNREEDDWRIARPHGKVDSYREVAPDQ